MLHSVGGTLMEVLCTMTTCQRSLKSIALALPRCLFDCESIESLQGSLQGESFSRRIGGTASPNVEHGHRSPCSLAKAAVEATCRKHFHPT